MKIAKKLQTVFHETRAQRLKSTSLDVIFSAQKSSRPPRFWPAIVHGACNLHGRREDCGPVSQPRSLSANNSDAKIPQNSCIFDVFCNILRRFRGSVADQISTKTQKLDKKRPSGSKPSPPPRYFVPRFTVRRITPMPKLLRHGTHFGYRGEAIF